MGRPKKSNKAKQQRSSNSKKMQKQGTVLPQASVQSSSSVSSHQNLLSSAQKKWRASLWLSVGLNKWRIALISLIFNVAANIIAALVLPLIQPTIAITQPLGMMITSIFVTLTIASVLAFFFFKKKPSSPSPQVITQPSPPQQAITQRSPVFIMGLSIGLPALSLGLLCSLLLLLVVRPIWCPSFLCTSANVSLPTSQRGTTDQPLDVHFITLNGGYYALTNPPSTYSATNLPLETGASRIDKGSATPYRLILQLKNVRVKGFGLYITDIVLTINDIQPLPDSVRVWKYLSQETYPASLYTATYHGGQRGTNISAIAQNYFLRLAPSEAVTVDVHIQSEVVALLTFQIHIFYRIMDEDLLRSFTIKKGFHALFSNAENWSLYTMSQGRFIPA